MKSAYKLRKLPSHSVEKREILFHQKFFREISSLVKNVTFTKCVRDNSRNFGDSRSAKSAVLTQLEALNFHFYDFLQF